MSIASAPTAERGRLLQHRIFLSIGHDEYWSGQQRVHVEAARDAGVHLVGLGNTIRVVTRGQSGSDVVLVGESAECALLGAVFDEQEEVADLLGIELARRDFRGPGFQRRPGEWDARGP